VRCNDGEETREADEGWRENKEVCHVEGLEERQTWKNKELAGKYVCVCVCCKACMCVCVCCQCITYLCNLTYE